MSALAHHGRTRPEAEDPPARLLDGVTLPAEAEFPKDIAGLSRRQYVPLRRRYTEVDLGFLVNRITEKDPELAEVVSLHQPSSGSGRRRKLRAPTRASLVLVPRRWN